MNESRERQGLSIEMRGKMALPYISCSSIGSTPPSSSSERSESEDEEGRNGSGRYADAGTVLESRPFGMCDRG